MAGVTPSEAMNSAIKSMSGQFKWGFRDCSTSTCDAFERLYGVNPLKLYPPYYNVMGAAKIIKNNGGNTDFASNTMLNSGLVECAPSAGSICVFWVNSRRWAMGLCLNIHSDVAFKAQLGMAIKKINKGSFWSLPCHL